VKVELNMKAALLTLCLAALPAAGAAATWLEVSAYNRVNPAAVVVVEIRADTNTNSKDATIRSESAEHIVRTATVVQTIEALVADGSVWFSARGDTVGTKSIKRWVRKTAVLFVKYSCPSAGSCTAFVDGYNGAFSRVVIDNAAAIAELKQETGKDSEFTLVESPAAGFEGFVRRSAIRSVNFICSNTTTCTQADVLVPGGTRITRDAAGIRALQGISR
jgi:hypothetical protein